MTFRTCVVCGCRSASSCGLCRPCALWTSGYRLQSPDPEVFFYLVVAVIARAKADSHPTSEVPPTCTCGRPTALCAGEFMEVVFEAVDEREPWLLVEAVGKLACDAALEAREAVPA